MKNTPTDFRWVLLFYKFYMWFRENLGTNDKCPRIANKALTLRQNHAKLQTT